MKKGPGGSRRIGKDSTDFGVELRNNYFFADYRTRHGRSYFLYADKCETKIVQGFALHEDVSTTCEMKQKDFLPMDVYEEVNPWYSIKTENVFCPMGGETTQEAIMNQTILLREAANCEKKMAQLIDGFNDTSDLLDDDRRSGELAEDGQGWNQLPVNIPRDDILSYTCKLQTVALLYF